MHFSISYDIRTITLLGSSPTVIANISFHAIPCFGWSWAVVLLWWRTENANTGAKSTNYSTSCTGARVLQGCWSGALICAFTLVRYCFNSSVNNHLFVSPSQKQVNVLRTGEFNCLKCVMNSLLSACRSWSLSNPLSRLGGSCPWHILIPEFLVKFCNWYRQREKETSLELWTQFPVPCS